VGWCQIISSNGEGRFTVRLDFGESMRAAIMSALEQRISALQPQMTKADLALTEAEEAHEQSKAVLAALLEQIAQSPPELIEPMRRAYSRDLHKMQELVAELQQRELRQRTIADEIELRGRQIAYWRDEVKCVETRDVWCAGYVEESSGYRATIEIDGEADLILLHPNNRAWVPRDGELRARALLSPEQAYWNAAALPGWQKHRPTYRYGTITDIDWDANTCSVKLADAKSSVQRLGINKHTVLDRLSTNYAGGMRTFGVDDRVVVEFINQAWELPQLIGFLDNPRRPPPIRWPYFINKNIFGKIYEPLYVDLAARPLFDLRGNVGVRYEVVDGELPPGLSLDRDTCILSGTPTDVAAMYRYVTIRCSDRFFVAGKNRRYADSVPMLIAINTWGSIHYVTSTNNGDAWGLHDPPHPVELALEGGPVGETRTCVAPPPGRGMLWCGWSDGHPDRQRPADTIPQYGITLTAHYVILPSRGQSSQKISLRPEAPRWNWTRSMGRSPLSGVDSWFDSSLVPDSPTWGKETGWVNNLPPEFWPDLQWPFALLLGARRAIASFTYDGGDVNYPYLMVDVSPQE